MMRVSKAWWFRHKYRYVHEWLFVCVCMFICSQTIIIFDITRKLRNHFYNIQCTWQSLTYHKWSVIETWAYISFNIIINIEFDKHVIENSWDWPAIFKIAIINSSSEIHKFFKFTSCMIDCLMLVHSAVLCWSIFEFTSWGCWLYTHIVKTCDKFQSFREGCRCL